MPKPTATAVEHESRRLLRAWRRQIGNRIDRRRPTSPRPLAGLGYLTYGPPKDGLIEVHRLVLVGLYDEPSPDRFPAIRLAGVVGCKAAWGVRFAGERFLKDLSRPPVGWRSGQPRRFINEQLLNLALELDAFVELHSRYRPRQLPMEPQLPPLWAAFRQADASAAALACDELHAACQCAGLPARALFLQTVRRCRGLHLLPLEWVTTHWARFVDVYADLSKYPPRQVFAPPSIPDGLQGFQGAAEFDLTLPGFRKAMAARWEARGIGQHLAMACPVDPTAAAV
jgi:hypothetical protein